MQFSFISLVLFILIDTIIFALPFAKRDDAFSGRGTFFAPGEGACETHASASDHIVALNGNQYGNMDAISGWCGKSVMIKNNANGKMTYAVIQDACPTCNHGDLDMSPAVFNTLSEPVIGVIPITWWVTDGPQTGGKKGGGGGEDDSGDSSSPPPPPPPPSTTITEPSSPPPTPTPVPDSSSKETDPFAGNLGNVLDIMNNLADTLAQVQEAGILNF